MSTRAGERLGNNNEMELAEEGEGVQAFVEELVKQPVCTEPIAVKAKREDECRVTEATVLQAEEEKGERPQLRITTSGIHAVRKLVSPNGKSIGQHQGFGIERGTVELVKIPRKEWIHPQSLPLPVPPPKAAPIIHEFCRPWRALRLRPYSSDPLLRKAEVSQDQSLLKNYEPRFSAGEPTFPTEVSLPTFLEPRVSVEDAHVFLVSIHLRFTLGMVEPLFCRLVVYDISLGCRVTEEFSYSIPGAVDANGNIIKRRVPISSAKVPHALFYALPNHLPQHLYLVLKVSKILMGDGESATSPYCFPEKFASETEQQKLIEKAADCFRRLGRYRQPLAWGAIALMEGSSRPMTLYRQRTTMSDDQRLPLITEAVRGTLKEKVVPSVCEFDLERIDDQRLTESKFQSASKGRSIGKNTLASLPPVPVLDILDPFSSASVSSSQSYENEESSPEHVPSQADSMLIQCREVQPFCHPSMASAFGLTGCGPVAVSYMNVMYLYPIHLERFQYRNIAIQVQLLQKEVDFLCGLKDFEAQGAVLQAIYAPNQEIISSGYTLVNYHQKNPQFENEIKICLPEKITLAHHILFTFYHVHCKKIQPNQQQQEIVGYAILPVLQKGGTIVQDNNYVMNVFATPIASKASTTGGVISLSPGYVAAAREAGIDTAKTSLTCRTRVLSSIHSQDKAVSSFLQPFRSGAFGSETKDQSVLDDDQIVNRLLGLRQASNTNVCYFFFPIARFVLGYLRFGSCVVRWAAFRAFLAVLEKASWTPHRSLKQDANQILHNFVHVVFDEYAIESPCGPVAAVTTESPHPQSIFHAILMEWLIILQDSSAVEDNVETKRSSLAYSNMLLQLILKSMAMHTLHQYGLKNGGAVGLLPMTLSDDDDELTEAVLCELVYCIGNHSNGLLLQKEVNRSIAYFCRGLFLVAKNQAPACTISQYMVWVSANQRDPNVLVHVLFPFIRILIDFEYFAVVNGACTAKNQRRSTLLCAAEPSSQLRGWLAKIVFEKLLYVADEQKEEKIRCDAVRLLRRMFVAQVYNQFHQSQDHQEQIALIYFSFFPSIAQFTTDGKLLYSSVSSAGVMSNGGDAPDKYQELKKELLICVAHLLSSVSTPYLSRFFQQFNGDMKLHAHESGGHEFNPSVSLSPTGALMHYRKIVEERNELQNRHHRRSMLKSTTRERKDTVAQIANGDKDQKETLFVEVRVHACLALVRHMIETFLVDEPSIPSGTLWQQLLSPDLVTREGRLSLLDIEMNLKHRRISRQRNSVSNDGCNASGSIGSNLIGKNSGATANAIRSPNPKLVSVGSSNSLGSNISSGPSRIPSNKSLPRNWGKNNTPVPRRISTSLGSESKSGSGVIIGSSVQVGTNQNLDEEDPGDYDVHLKCVYRIIADTALRSLQTAVDQFEWVIRIIEKPFDCSRERANNPNESDADALESVTIDHAFAFLGSLTDLLFLLINRANTIETLYQNFDGDVEEDTGEDNEEIEDKEQCFLTDLFQYLETFLARFQKALFACRITNLPLIHDEYRIQLLLSIAATGKSIVVRQRASRLLCKLLAVCYEQTGSFQLVKGPVFKVFCSVFFSTRQPVLSTETIREAIEEMRQYSFTEDNVTPAFHLQFKELVNGLITQIKVFEMWQIAMSSPEQLRDYEEIEEGLYQIVRAVSPFWLLDEKRIWLDALLRLHETRQKYAEATCCKLECIGFTQQTAQEEERGDFLFWEIKELMIAREFAEKASWAEQQISISEQLLVCLKEQKRYSEYLETLKYLERVIYQHAEAEAMNGGYGAGHAFYRITYTSDCVSTHISKHEYIYKRNKFMSLGEFVTEMKAILRVKYPMCERVDVVPESKPLTGDDQTNVIFMRITSVEEVKTPERFSNKPQNDPHYKPTVFKFAIPFTLGSSSYGKTSDQMKRITYLSVAQPFPCALNRQVVIERREEIRCPIENSMDDIQKRCFVLQDEINKEVQGRTDLKTLTLVLKGSVDTHVHGGIPEVIDSFLASIPKSQDAANEDDDGSPTQALPPLLNARGKVMSADDSLQKRHHLANLLAHFLKLCWQCLMISREAYRRASSQSSVLTAPAPVAPAFAISQLQTAGDPSSPNSSSSMFTSLPAGGLANFSGNSAKNVNITSGFMVMTPDDDYNLSPLQLEFEKSFVSLVELVQSKVSFPYQSAGDVTQLRLQMQLKRVGSLAPSIHNASAPLVSSSSSGMPFH